MSVFDFGQNVFNGPLFKKRKKEVRGTVRAASGTPPRG
jgi:hypothetical protein